MASQFKHLGVRMIKAALPLALASLMTAGFSQADVPSVAVDITPVHSLVMQVMGELGEPKLVISAGASPHAYSLRPSEARALQDADIVFWVSAGLTPWLSETIVTLAPDATRVELLEVDGVTELAMRENALFEAHEHDDHADEEHEGEEHEGEGHDEHEGEEHEGEEHHDDESEHDEHDEHDHGEHDPHAWLDPSNAAIWLDAIADELSKADPANTETYQANAASGKAELEQLKSDIQETLAPVRGRSFIVFHDAYQYFENAFDFAASGAISVSDASKPSPARIQEIRDRVSQANVTCVLTEPQFNPDLVSTVLDGTDARTTEIDSLGSHLDVGPTFYNQLLRELAKNLAGCV
ncbi:MAG: zinc ABC transporter substrate-binding protein [Granulosicoccus sp.]